MPAYLLLVYYILVTDTKQNKEHNIACPCGYSWHTDSKLLKVSCPNCGGKVKNPTLEGNENVQRTENIA